MPQSGMDYWVIAGVVIPALALILALRTPAIREKLGFRVTGSKRVAADISKSAEANVDIKRSEDIRINIGD